jgi:hypothetical protein
MSERKFFTSELAGQSLKKLAHFFKNKKSNLQCKNPIN